MAKKPKRKIPEPDIEELTPSEVSAAIAETFQEALAKRLTPAVEWRPPEGQIVSDERSFRIYVGGVWYEHVSEAPDGRWVYARS